MRVVRQEGLNLMTQLFTVNRAKNSRSQGQTKKTRERPTTLHYQKSLCMCTRYTSQSCTKVGQTNTIYQNTQKGRPTILFAKSYKWYFFKRYLNMEQIFIQKKDILTFFWQKWMSNTCLFFMSGIYKVKW